MEMDDQTFQLVMPPLQANLEADQSTRACYNFRTETREKTEKEKLKK